LAACSRSHRRATSSGSTSTPITMKIPRMQRSTGSFGRPIICLKRFRNFRKRSINPQGIFPLGVNHADAGGADRRDHRHRRNTRNTRNGTLDWPCQPGGTVPGVSSVTGPESIYLSHGFQRIAARAGLPGLRFHDCRHAHATEMLWQGIHSSSVFNRTQDLPMFSFWSVAL